MNVKKNIFFFFLFQFVVNHSLSAMDIRSATPPMDIPQGGRLEDCFRSTENGDQRIAMLEAIRRKKDEDRRREKELRRQRLEKIKCPSGENGDVFEFEE